MSQKNSNLLWVLTAVNLIAGLVWLLSAFNIFSGGGEINFLYFAVGLINLVASVFWYFAAKKSN